MEKTWGQANFSITMHHYAITQMCVTQKCVIRNSFFKLLDYRGIYPIDIAVPGEKKKFSIR